MRQLAAFTAVICAGFGIGYWVLPKLGSKPVASQAAVEVRSENPVSNDTLMAWALKQYDRAAIQAAIDQHPTAQPYSYSFVEVPAVFGRVYKVNAVQYGRIKLILVYVWPTTAGTFRTDLARLFTLDLDGRFEGDSVAELIQWSIEQHKSSDSYLRNESQQPLPQAFLNLHR